MGITPNLLEIGLNLVDDPIYTHRFYFQGVTGSIRYMPSVDDEADRFMGRVDGATEPRIVWVDGSTI